MNLEKIVHHGVEGVVFVTVGMFATSSFLSSCTAYGVGKITYLSTRKLLDVAAPDLQKNIKRHISWIPSLLLGGSTLKIVHDKVAKEAMSAGATAIVTGGTTAIALGVRALCDKEVKRLTRHRD